MRGNAQVLYALNQLSNTVKDTARGGGQSDIDLASIGLQGARQEYDLSRQAKMDDMRTEEFETGRSERELGKSKADSELSQRGELFNMGSLGVNALSHMAAISKSEPDQMQYQRLVKDLGYEITPEGATVHADGSPVYKHQVDKQKLTEWVMTHFDSDKSAESQKDIALLKYASDNDGKAYDATMKTIKDKPTGIDARIASAEKRRSIMAGMGSNTDKIDARIDKLYSEKYTDRRSAARTKAVGLSKKGTSEKAGWFTLKNSGKPVTISQLKTLYREHNNIPDEFELMLMEKTGGPEGKNQAAEYRKKMSANSFRDFVNRMTHEGGQLNWDETPEAGNNDPLGIR